MELLSAYWPYLVFGGLMFLMMRGGGCCGGHQHGSHGHNQGNKQGGAGTGDQGSQLAENQANDPVCGRTVNKKEAVYKLYDGQEFYFCSEDCARIFDDRRNMRAG